MRTDWVWAPAGNEVRTELEGDMSSQKVESTKAFQLVDFDVVITVWDNSTQNCPVWLGGGYVEHLRSQGSPTQ